MKYRIKITTFKSGRKEFLAQVKKRFFWVSLSYDGEEYYRAPFRDREMALDAIDAHIDGNFKKLTVEFQHFKKLTVEFQHIEK